MARKQTISTPLYNDPALISKFFYYDETSHTFIRHVSNHKPAGTKINTGYMHVRCDHGAERAKHYLIHRLVWIMHNGPIPDGVYIDHINGNRSDNRISNLRLATHQQNIGNSRRKEPASGLINFKVITKPNGKQYMYAMVQGESVRVHSMDEAKKVIKKLRIKHFGEFAYLDDLN
jgi:hypothetical protein